MTTDRDRRDAYIRAAMTGLLANSSIDDATDTNVADWSVAYADAAIAEADRTSPEPDRRAPAEPADDAAYIGVK